MLAAETGIFSLLYVSSISNVPCTTYALVRINITSAISFQPLDKQAAVPILSNVLDTIHTVNWQEANVIIQHGSVVCRMCL